MQIDRELIRLVPMTDERYRQFFQGFKNDPDICRPGQAYVRHDYSDEEVARYIKRQRDFKRIPLAIMHGGEVVGEILIKDIEPHRCATLSVTLKSARYKDHGIGTRAEELAIRYVFDELDIPTLYADTFISNGRSRHVLEKAGFKLIQDDGVRLYYRIDREQNTASL